MKRFDQKSFRRNAVPLIAVAVLAIAALFALSACTKAAASASTTTLPGLWGEVTDISGNQVTLKLIAIPTGGFPTGGFTRPTGGYTRPTGGYTRPTGGARPTGGYTRLTISYTGETRTLIIPVGVQITESTRGTGGAVTTTVVDISKVQVGNFLMIYYGSNGKSISKVTLTTTAITGRGGFGGGTFPSGGAFPTGGFPGDNGGSGGDGQPPAGG